MPAPATVRFIHPLVWTEGLLVVFSARSFFVIAVIHRLFLWSFSRILHSPNRGGFLRLPMLKINRLIRPRVTC
jgi:hypothetical protein